MERPLPESIGNGSARLPKSLSMDASIASLASNVFQARFQCSREATSLREPVARAFSGVLSMSVVKDVHGNSKQCHAGGSILVYFTTARKSAAFVPRVG